MRRGQSIPERWLMVAGRSRDLPSALSRLRAGDGILVIPPIAAGELRRLERRARARDLMIVVEHPTRAARVHNSRELRRALLARAPLIYLSPIYPTPSHPDWRPIPRMRAAALARLGKRRLLALGGMDARRYASVAPLGFIGWGGISAFRT